MMKQFICWLIIATSFASKAQDINIIPQPVSVDVQKGSFTISSQTQIVTPDASLRSTADFFNNYLNKVYGFKLSITSKPRVLNTIILTGNRDKPIGTGNYGLVVSNDHISVNGETNDGVFYGVQTLIQLLPIKNLKTKTQNLKIPQLTISDHPRFAYRGMHLDCARHFWPVSFIKQYIDYLALHKMNYFHWHLTDDQGWRIEIKKYPGLTKTGAWRNGTIIGRYPGKGNDEIPYGGFYTREQIKEIVKYAADRYITVVPEIEMPGHSSAAIASYPFLSCFPNEPTKIPANMISKRSVAEQSNGKIKLVQETWGVFDDVFCAGKDSTFVFLQNVLDEVLALFPSKYIHAGGDECPKSNWKRCPRCQLRMKNEKLKDEHELQSYFIQRIEKYLTSKGRTLIGWDEILEGGLAPNAMVMSWRGEEGGIAAAKLDHDVVMTPGDWCYLDHSQSENEDSVTIGGYTTVEKVYGYEPIPPALNEQQGRHILGAQGNVWTEYMKNPKKVEYMIFPRMSALSEVLWSSKGIRNWNGFEKRLMTQFKRYELWGANYSKAYFDLKATVLPTKDNQGIIWRITKKENKGSIKVGDKFSFKTINANSYDYKIKEEGLYNTAWIEVTKRIPNPTEARMGIEFRYLSNPIIQQFHFNKVTGKKITLKNPPSQNYPGDGAFTLVNGVINEKGFARSKEFLGFLGEDCEAIIDFEEIIPVSFVVVNCLTQTPSWIWQPRSAEVFGSSDGEKFYSLKQSDAFTLKENGKGTIQLSFRQTYTRYLKVVVKNWGTIPEGNPGAGNKAWLFVDEIEVN